MSIDQDPNDFTLSVEFAGICLYVIDRRQETTVRVLMPTCLPLGGVSDKHEDGERGTRHVPYLLMDLANLTQFEKLIPSLLIDVPDNDDKAKLKERIRGGLGPDIQPGFVGDGPQFGVVRRLRREELLFELEQADNGIRLDPDPLPLPRLDVYKEWIRLKEGLLLDIPRNERLELNVRTILKGGTLAATTVGGSDNGGKRPDHGPDWDKVPAAWTGSIKWTRTIPGDSLTIRIRSWDTGQETPLTLRPVTRGGKEVIELKIAILCENNPLEWKEFEPRFVKKDDRDFKWLFRFFEAIDGGSVLKAIRKEEFPYPKLDRLARTAGSTGCTGGQFGIP